MAGEVLAIVVGHYCPPPEPTCLIRRQCQRIARAIQIKVEILRDARACVPRVPNGERAKEGLDRARRGAEFESVRADEELVGRAATPQRH